MGKNVKKFTCLESDDVRVEGAIAGSRETVLQWMKGRFPGLRKRDGEEGVDGDNMIAAWEFFYEGALTAYVTGDGKEVFLAEIVEKEA